MKEINRLTYLELDDDYQFQIARELVDDVDQGYDPLDYKDLKIFVYEYDPNVNEDLNILLDFYNQKVSDEGEPLEEDLKYYYDNINELISNPILVMDGYCREGRHRLKVALNQKHKIRAYIC